MEKKDIILHVEQNVAFGLKMKKAKGYDPEGSFSLPLPLLRKITEKMITDYELYLRNEERSNATIKKYSRDLLAFLLFLPMDKHFSKETVICYKEYLTAHYAPASVNSMLAALNGFLSFMEWAECKVKPLKIQRKVFCSKEKELTKQEYLRLVEAAKRRKNQRLCLVMETICSTGIRVSELCFITVEAVMEHLESCNL